MYLYIKKDKNNITNTEKSFFAYLIRNPDVS